MTLDLGRMVKHEGRWWSTQHQLKRCCACRRMDTHVVGHCQRPGITIPVILVLADVVAKHVEERPVIALRLPISLRVPSGCERIRCAKCATHLLEEPNQELRAIVKRVLTERFEDFWVDELLERAFCIEDQIWKLIE